VLNAATGHTAAWTVFSVSQHPEVEAKIVEELRALGLLATAERPVPRPIEWEDINKLTYLNAVIKVSSTSPTGCLWHMAGHAR
jgi:cytochrome P450